MPPTFAIGCWVITCCHLSELAMLSCIQNRSYRHAAVDFVIGHIGPIVAAQKLGHCCAQ